MHLSVDGSIVYGVIIDAVLGTLLHQKLTHTVIHRFAELRVWIRMYHIRDSRPHHLACT